MTLVSVAEEQEGGRTRVQEMRLILRLIRRDPLTVTGVFLVTIFILLAILAPVFAPYPDQGLGLPVPERILLPPSSVNLFGTDYLGRDILSRIIYGAQISLSFAFTVAILSSVIGMVLGAVAGYYGGMVDDVIMRVTEVFLSFPPLLLAIALLATIGPGLTNAVVALSLTWWPWYTRLARAQTVSLRESHFVEAARAIGVRSRTIVRRHIIPNILTPIVVQATLDMASAILVEAGFGFIGLGAQAPSPSWGLMVSTGRYYILTNWWFPTFPGLAIFALALGFNFLGDGFREILDPRLRRVVRLRT